MGEAGDDPCTVLYRMKSSGMCNYHLVCYAVGRDGEIVKGDNGKDMAICRVAQDVWQWAGPDVYCIEVAASVDAALMVTAMAVIDYVNEGLQHTNHAYPALA